ncbi:MAG: porin family protein [Gammaproteobacteria bacterium]|nr:porin family protein [Gammaproteobacteria bacterium]
MKKIIMAAVLASTFGAAQASEKFNSGYVGVTAGSYSAEGKINGTKVKGDGAELGLGVVVGFHHRFAGSKFVLGGEGQIQQNLGKASCVTCYNGGLASGDIKQAWNISVLPGFLVGDDSLLYARLGFGSVNYERKVGSFQATDDVDSSTYGLGYKAFVNEATSLSVEYKSVKASKSYGVDKIEFDTAGIEVGVQYQF